MLDFKPTSSWQCPKGDDLLKEKAEFSPLLLFFLRVLLLHCSERLCKRGCNHGGTGAEMAKGAQICWLLPGAPGSEWTVSHRVRHLGSFPTTAINLFLSACAGLNQQTATTRRWALHPTWSAAVSGKVPSQHHVQTSLWSPFNKKATMEESFLSHISRSTYTSNVYTSLSIYKYLSWVQPFRFWFVKIHRGKRQDRSIFYIQ